MGFMSKLAGNLNEVSSEALTQEYGAYLMEDENIWTGFKLVRDVVLITDKRIIDIDKQGATGKKMRVDSINLNSIFHVSAETAGFGADDSELNLQYIVSPYFKVSSGASIAEKKFEFPKKYNIQSLYQYLQEIAYRNHENLNK
ncbi:MAG: PH domain-containing protein [Hydrogeniiclostridium sp.]